MDLTTRRITGIGLALTLVATVYAVTGGSIKAGTSIVGALIFLLWGFWPDIRRLWARAEAVEPGNLEVILKKHEEDGFGFLPTYSSMGRLEISGHTTLTGFLSEIEVINHSPTAPAEILNMRLVLLDPTTGKEVEPFSIKEVKLDPEKRELRRIPPVDHRRFSLSASIIFKGHLDRDSATGRVFLIVKTIGSRDELKIGLGREFFP